MRTASLSPFCIIWLAAVPAQGGIAVIDDSATVPYNAALAMHWQELAPRGAANDLMVGTLQLRVRLNVAPWLHRAGRVYMVLPAQQPGAMSVSWITHGRLLPGQLTSGARTLVYAGPITTPFLEDDVQLTITVDGRRMLRAYPVNFRFEMVD